MEPKVLSQIEYELKKANEYVSAIDGKLYALDNGGAAGTVLIPIKVEGFSPEEEQAEVMKIAMMSLEKEAIAQCKKISFAAHCNGQVYSLEAVAASLSAQMKRLPEAESKGMGAAVKEIEGTIAAIHKAMADNSTASWEDIAWRWIRAISQKTSFHF
jgi:hypothetical protein